MRRVSINLWKSDKPVSTVCDFQNDYGKFVRIESIHDGLLGFLKHVGAFIKLFGLYAPEKFSIEDSDIPELKSPTIRKCRIFSLMYPTFFLEY